MLVTLLVGVLLMREPRLQRLDDHFVAWLLHNADPVGPAAPLTVVNLGSGGVVDKPGNGAATDASSPIEYALFLQAVLEFRPAVVAIQPVLRWPPEKKDQQQILIDQAQRVSKLLLGARLTSAPDPDAPSREVPIFHQVSGKRAGLAEFSGVEAEAMEELRPISTPGFVNFPPEITTSVHVPLLFQYRGEVVPSFAFQAVLLWLRMVPDEVKIELGSHILMPNGWTIPIGSDGTAVISPKAVNHVRRITLSELLVASQQRDAGKPTTAHLENLEDQIVLLHRPEEEIAANVFASTIATIQTNAFVRRVSWIFDIAVLAAAIAVTSVLRYFSRLDALLGAAALTAGYSLAALAVLSHMRIWLPGCLPLGIVMLLLVMRLSLRDAAPSAEPAEEAPSA
jgi:hypothetical protein